MRNKAGHRGFTLIELMIVIVIVAILATVAYPSYVDHVQRSRRADAMDALLSEAQRAERWFTVNNTYTGFTLASGTSPGGFYLMTLPTLTADQYTIGAAATGPQLADDCATFELNQAGVRGGTAGCW